jgi:hypothetical protein
MPSDGSDRPHQLDALVAEVLGQRCDVLARADAARDFDEFGITFEMTRASY